MPDTTTRLWFGGILAGMALLAALAFVVIGPGRFHPSPPSLSDNPVVIPGQLAYLHEDGCVRVVLLSSGNDREVICPATRTAVVAWLDAGTVAIADWRGSPNPEWTAVNIETGETTSLGTHPGPRFDGDPTLNNRIRVAHDGEVFIVEDGEERSIYDAGFPEFYQPRPITFSPGDAWLLLGYNGPRGDGQELWIVAADGSVARTVTKDADWSHQAVSWWVDGEGAAPDISTPSLP